MRKQLLSLSLIILTLSGCVFDDLSDCPASSGAMKLALRYEQAGDPSGTPPVSRADFYVFDADRRFVCLVSDENASFHDDYRREIELPEGDYTVVAWGNFVPGVYTLTPSFFVPGTTPFDQARLTLSSLTGGQEDGQIIGPATREFASPLTETEAFATGPSVPLYHAMRQSVHVTQGESTEVFLSFHRNTKDINLIVDFPRGDGMPGDAPAHYPDASIRCSDGILNFENNNLPCPRFSYLPARRDEHTRGFNALFHKMTLRLNPEMDPEIILSFPGRTSSDPPVVYYRKSLMKLLKGTGYDTQEKLDATDTYNIELNFSRPPVEGDTQATVSIRVNGWVYVETSDDV